MNYTGPIPAPLILGNRLSTSSFSNGTQVINDVGATGAAWRFNGNGEIITSALIYISAAVTGTGYYSVTIETDSSLAPSGTTVTGGDAVTGTITGAAAQDLLVSGFSYQTVVGTPYWVVIRGAAGSDDSNKFTVKYAGVQTVFGYGLRGKNYTTSWQTGQIGGGICLLNSASDKPIGQPIKVVTYATSGIYLYDNHEVANIYRMSLDYPIIITGVFFPHCRKVNSPTGLLGAKLYKGSPSNGGVLASVSGGFIDVVSASNMFYVEFQDNVVIEPGEVFAISAYNTEPTNDSTSNAWDTAYYDYFTGTLAKCEWGAPTSSLYNGSTWADTADRQYVIYPIAIMQGGMDSRRGSLARGI